MGAEAEVDFIGQSGQLDKTLDSVDSQFEKSGSLWQKALDGVTHAGEKVESALSAIENTGFSDAMSAAFDTVKTKAAEMADSVITAMENAEPAVHKGLIASFDAVGATAKGVGKVIGTSFSAGLSVAGVAATAFGKAMGAALAVGTGGLSLIVGYGTKIAGWLLDAVVKSDEWQKSLIGIAKVKDSVLVPLFEWFNTKIVSAIEKAVDVVLKFYAVGKTVGENLKQTWEIAWTSSQLSAIKFYEGTKHFFSEVLPAYLAWLSDNWVNVFKDIYNSTTTIVSNMWDNLSNFFSNVWKWLSGDETDFKWKGLLDGFESTLQELPEIAERHKTDLEKSLELDLSKNVDSFADKYRINLDKIKATFKSANFEGNNLSASVNNAAKLLPDLLSKIPQLGTDIEKAVTAGLKGVKPPKFLEMLDEKQPTQQPQGYGGYETGGAAALFQRIQSAAATASPEVEAAVNTSKNTERTAENTKRAAEGIEKLFNSFANGFAATFG